MVFPHHRFCTSPRLFSIVLAGLCLLLAAGCGSGHQQQSPTVRMNLALVRPMGYRDPDGRPHGFIVDAMSAAAARAGLRIEWSSSGNGPENDQALRSGAIDVLAGVDTVERRREFYMSDPWWSLELTILVPASSSIQQESGLAGRQIAVPVGAGSTLRRYYPRSSIVPVNSAGEAAGAVCGGRASAAIIAAMYIPQLLSGMPAACEGFQWRTFDSTSRVDFVLLSRPAQRERVQQLKAALDTITSEGMLAAIAARYPPVSTPHATRLADLVRIRYQRRTMAILSISGALIVLLSGIYGLQSVRARRRLRAVNQRLQADLIARDRAEAALRDSEARFRALFESAPQTVVAVNREGLIVFANHRGGEMFRREDLVGRPIEQIVPGFLNDAAPATGVRADGHKFPVEIHRGAVETEEGLTLVLIADISERKLLQQQLLQSQKLESVGQLAGGVAHDFNNLLTVISGYTQMALDSTSPASPLQEPLLQVAHAADRAAGLIRQLLAFSRQQSAHPVVLSLSERVQELQKMLRRLIGEHIALAVQCDAAGLVLADPIQIEQVVVNLAVNARDAMPEGGTLRIATADAEVHGGEPGLAGIPAGVYVMLEISDTGSGIPPEVIGHIFEPFFTTKEFGKGTGLGLSTVYGIVKQSGGWVLVDSLPESGTTFRVLLPAVIGAPEGSPERPDATAFGGHETVLVAEDETRVRQLVCSILETHGYRVLEAQDGQCALDTALTHAGAIDLLLSDLVMPGMSGAALAEGFRRMRPGSAVLHMSGYNDRAQPEEGLGVVPKPFLPAELLKRVRESLDERQGHRLAQGPATGC